MIDRTTIDKIMDAANIVDVVSDFVTLKRAGANLKGLCPFHDDRTPSFIVSPAKNFCKCFACGEGGSPLGFIMKHEQLSYPDALRYLAKKYGITIEEKEMTKEEMQSRNDRESMLLVNDWAKNWFRKQLNETPDGKAIGLAYFRGRGFRDDILEKFQVGYCPSGRTTSLSKEAIEAGYEEKYLVNDPDTNDPKDSLGTGLSLKTEKGDLRDRFHDRVMWPIFNISGRVAGFGGRVLDARTHGVNIKYQNSPESIIYSKRKELFGLYQAKQAIRLKDLCYIVEGYTDVMAMHQNGIENVVASSGTALTFDQIRMLKRLTSNITLIFDGDEAGIKASLRGTDMLLSEGMNVKLLLLPDGDDPDSFGKKHNETEYQEYMASHQVDFIQYKTETLMKEAEGDPGKQGKVVSNIVESIAAIPDEITRTLYAQQAAQMLHLEERLITTAVTQELARRMTEKRKEEEREEYRKAMNGYVPPQDELRPSLDFAENPAIAEEKPQPQKRKEANTHERLLMKMVMEHGEVVIGNMENENGENGPLTLVEYIQLSLNADSIALQDPLHKKLMEEALTHIKEAGFTTERFFINHADPQICELAFQLADNEELSKFYQQQNKYAETTDIDPKQLLESTEQLLNELKLHIIREEIRELKQLSKDPELMKDKKKYRQLMMRFIETKNVEKELARECGERVLMN